MQITRQIIFHAGHMLKDDQSKCYQPHGHEYVFKCTIEGGVQEEGSGEEVGMVMNFGNLKEIMMTEVHDNFDHKFLIQKNDPRCEKFLEAVGPHGVVLLEWAPTAENMAEWIYWRMEKFMPKGVRVAKVYLQETSNCYAVFQGPPKD